MSRRRNEKAAREEKRPLGLSLEVEPDRDAGDPILILDGHEFERVRTAGWDFLPAGRKCDETLTYDALFVRRDGRPDAKPLTEPRVAEGLLAAKRVYEEKHPETKHGRHRNHRNDKTAHRKVPGSDSFPRFTLAAGKATGLSETHIKNLIRAREKLDDGPWKEFKAGRITLEEALRTLSKPRRSTADSELTRAIHKLKKVLEAVPAISDTNRGRLEELLALIDAALEGPTDPTPVITEDGAIRAGGGRGKEVRRSR